MASQRLEVLLISDVDDEQVGRDPDYRNNLQQPEYRDTVSPENYKRTMQKNV